MNRRVLSRNASFVILSVLLYTHAKRGTGETIARLNRKNLMSKKHYKDKNGNRLKNEINEVQWNLFVKMLDDCEKKQGKACEGCPSKYDCEVLTNAVSNLCTSYKIGQEYSNATPSQGNPQVEGHEADLKGLVKFPKPTIGDVPYIPRGFSAVKSKGNYPL